METFVAVAQRGSLASAARAEGVVPAIIARRLNALEEHLGVKLLVRSTRRLTLTPEGHAFLEDAQRLLSDLAQMEANVSAGGSTVRGHLRITAPAGFGRRHVAPLVPAFRARYPQVTISLNLSDRVVDLIAEGYDCAVRVGDLPDSSLVSVRLADNRRRVVAAPQYLQRRGTPQHPHDLLQHDCLVLSSEASQTRGWAFSVPVGGSKRQHIYVRPRGPLDCTDGQVLYEWCRAGLGLAWRSTWEVQADLDAGRLVPVLDDYAAAPNGVYAVFPSARLLPRRVRAWVDFLKEHYTQPGFWAQTHSAHTQ